MIFTNTKEEEKEMNARNSPNHKWRSFESALKWVHSQKIKNKSDWKKLIKSKNFPSDIPKTPDHVYKEQWKGYGYWYGTGKTSTHDRHHRSFMEAKEFVRTLNLKNKDEWNVYCKSGKKPDDIPATPPYVYGKKGWISWGDWLGHDYVAPRLRKYRSFREARKFAQSLNLKKRSEWWDFCRKKKHPNDIPFAPENTYKNKGWNGWSDFLGTTRSRNYRSFEDAIKYVHSLKLQSQTEWRKLIKSGRLPVDIPRSPRDGYKKYWTTWGDWLGTGRIAHQYKEHRSFKDARKFVSQLGLSGQKEWREYCKSEKKPDDIPATPYRVYKKDWTTWGDWLGTEFVSTNIKSQQWLSIVEAKIEARKIAKRLNIRTREQWMLAWHDGKIPKTLPSRLDSVYNPNLKRNKKRRQK